VKDGEEKECLHYLGMEIVWEKCVSKETERSERLNMIEIADSGWKYLRYSV
jgi:hypothetical protein